MFAVGQVRGGSVKHAAGTSMRFGGSRSPLERVELGRPSAVMLRIPHLAALPDAGGHERQFSHGRLRACWRTRTEWW